MKADTIRFVCDDENLVIRTTEIDRRILSIAAERAIPGSGNVIQQLFFWSDDTRPRSLQRSVILNMLEKVVFELNADFERLAMRYSHSATLEAHGIRVRTSGSGAISGIRMGGELAYSYALSGGVGERFLTKYEIDRPGLGPINITDCRHLNQIATDNMGQIDLRRRRLKTHLLSNFQRALEFLRARLQETVEFFYSEE